MKGEKWDTGKQDYYLLPLEILQPLADLMQAGERKGYKPFSCLGVFENADRRFYNATMRHLVASQRDALAKDEESECYHLASVAFNALMRLYHCKQEKDVRVAKIETMINCILAEQG